MRTPPRVALLAFAAFAAISCRGGSSRGGANPSPPPVEDSDAASRAVRPPGGRAPVIWIGLDGLDPEMLDRLSAQGALPNWSKLVAEGASAKLASYVPMISPVVWTTLATGVGPDVH